MPVMKNWEAIALEETVTGVPVSVSGSLSSSSGSRV